MHACVLAAFSHTKIQAQNSQLVLFHFRASHMRRLLALLQLVVAPCGLTTAWCVHHDHFHFANMKYHFQKARHFAKELPVTRLNVQTELNVAMRHLVALETEMEGGDGAVPCSPAHVLVLGLASTHSAAALGHHLEAVPGAADCRDCVRRELRGIIHRSPFKYIAIVVWCLDTEVAEWRSCEC